jgi:hypothetical protein
MRPCVLLIGIIGIAHPAWRPPGGSPGSPGKSPGLSGGP